MAWKNVDVPGLGLVQFPDTMSDEQVSAAIRQSLAQRPAEMRAPPKTMSGFVGNTVTSAGNVVEGLATAVTQPVQTARGFGEMVRNPSMVGQALKDRYGSAEAIGNTLYYDPVGSAMDASLGLGAAGATARGLGMAAKAGGMARTATGLGKAADVARTTSRAANPMVWGAEAAKAPFTLAGKATGFNTMDPMRLYQSALKPYRKSSLKHPIPEMQIITQTALDEKIPLNPNTMEIWAENFAEANNQLERVIAEGTGRMGAVLKPENVAKSLDNLKKTKMYRALPKAQRQAIYRQIDRARDEFLSEFKLPPAAGGGFTGMTAKRAQEMKQAVYDQVRMAKSSAFQTRLNEIRVNTNKALARGLKKELVRVFEELEAPNVRESNLLRLEPYLEQALWRIYKRDLTGIGTGISINAAHAMTGSKAAAMGIGAMRSFLEQPGIKTQLAIAIRNGQKAGGGKPYQAVRGLGTLTRNALGPRSLGAFERVDAYHRFLIKADEALNPSNGLPSAGPDLGSPAEGAASSGTPPTVPVLLPPQ